jgi:prepilin-type N-terminal cleavage/methylation domain-containing protein
MNLRRNAMKGFTLIEIAIVLGVFSVIMAGIWMVVSVVSENVRNYEANRQLQASVQGIRQIEQRITGYTSSAGTDITTRLDSQGAFPVEMRIAQATGNGNLNHPWAGTGNNVHVYVRATTTFGIAFTNVPKKACIQLVTKLSGGELSGLTELAVGGTNHTAANLPLNLVQAAAACTSASANTIEWRFGLRS